MKKIEKEILLSVIGFSSLLGVGFASWAVPSSLGASVEGNIGADASVTQDDARLEIHSMTMTEVGSYGFIQDDVFVPTGKLAISFVASGIRFAKAILSVTITPSPVTDYVTIGSSVSYCIGDSNPQQSGTLTNNTFTSAPFLVPGESFHFDVIYSLSTYDSSSKNGNSEAIGDALKGITFDLNGRISKAS